MRRMKKRSPMPAAAPSRSPMPPASSRRPLRKRPTSGWKRSCTNGIAAAEQSIAATRTSAMGNVGGIASDTAAAIVERLIGQAPAAHEVAAAVSETMKR